MFTLKQIQSFDYKPFGDEPYGVEVGNATIVKDVREEEIIYLVQVFGDNGFEEDYTMVFCTDKEGVLKSVEVTGYKTA